MTSPSDDELRFQNINAQLVALGRFVEAFELMVDDVRSICLERICFAFGSAVENETLVAIAFHHQVMTAKPLYDIMRAILAEIINKPSHFHFESRDDFKSLLGYIEVAYSNLYNKRNELLHGTWFIGHPTGKDPYAKEFHIQKFRITSDGLDVAKELPKDAEQLSKLADRCNTTRRWIAHVEYCITEKEPLSNYFKCENKTWYLRLFPDQNDWTTLPRK